MEEWLREFRPIAPRPALKAQILAAARNPPRPGLIDRLWNRTTWMAIAAGALVAVGLYAVPVRVDPDIAEQAFRRAQQKLPERIVVWTGRSETPRVMIARLEGPNQLRLEELK